MGGRADFSKSPRLSFLIKKTYQMNLISAGSTSLDSTFNRSKHKLFDAEFFSYKIQACIEDDCVTGF
jgi:hypothetical protein